MGQNSSTDKRYRHGPYEPPPGNNPELFFLDGEHKRERTSSFGNSRKKDKYVLETREKDKNHSNGRQRPTSVSDTDRWMSNEDQERLRVVAHKQFKSNKESHPLSTSTGSQEWRAGMSKDKGNRSPSSKKDTSQRKRSSSFSNKDKAQKEYNKLVGLNAGREKNGYTTQLKEVNISNNDVNKERQPTNQGRQVSIDVPDGMNHSADDHKYILSKQDREKEGIAFRKLESYRKKKAALTNSAREQQNKQLHQSHPVTIQTPTVQQQQKQNEEQKQLQNLEQQKQQQRLQKLLRPNHQHSRAVNGRPVSLPTNYSEKPPLLPVGPRNNREIKSTAAGSDFYNNSDRFSYSAERRSRRFRTVEEHQTFVFVEKVKPSLIPVISDQASLVKIKTIHSSGSIPPPASPSGSTQKGHERSKSDSSHLNNSQPDRDKTEQSKHVQVCSSSALPQPQIQHTLYQTQAVQDELHHEPEKIQIIDRSPKRPRKQQQEVQVQERQSQKQADQIEEPPQSQILEQEKLEQLQQEKERLQKQQQYIQELFTKIPVASEHVVATLPPYKPIIIDQSRNKATKSSTTSSTKRPPNQPDVVTNSVEPPAASEEIARLEALCEARTKQLNVARIQLKASASGFDAMTVLVKYLTEELDAFSCPEVTAKLKSVKSQLGDAEQQIALLKADKESLEKELCELRQQHVTDLQRLKDSHQEALVQLEQRLQAAKEKEIENVVEKYSHEVATLKSFLEKNISDLKAKHEKSLQDKEAQHTDHIEQIKQDHDLRIKDLQKQHEKRMEEITKTFENIKFTLSDKVEALRGECEEMRSREAQLQERAQHEADLKIHMALAKYQHLPAEIESLRAVMDMRNQELHELRSKKLDLEKQLEELPRARDKIVSLQQKVENLEAVIEIKGDYEKQLAEKHQILLRKFERESKANKRLSMDNEELAWRLQNSADSPDLLRRSISHSPTRTSAEPTPEVVRRRKSPACSIPTSPRNQTEFEQSPVTPQSPPKSNLKRSGTYDLLNKDLDEKDMKQSDV